MSRNVHTKMDHVAQALPLTAGGKIFMVADSSAEGYNAILERFASIDAYYAAVDTAINACVADRGDVIYIAPNYTQSITAAAGFALDVAGVSVIGLGEGNNRPVFTISSTDNAGTITQSGNNTTLKNIVVVTNDDGLTNAVVVSGNNCVTEFEHQDTSAAVEAATIVRGDTADNWRLKLKHNGFTAGNAMVSAVRLDDCDNVRIEIDAFGVVSTAWVEMVDVASTNVYVTGKTFTQGVTNGSRDIVDTITGSSWFGRIDDMSAGATYSGGSASAWATDDITALATAIDAVDNMLDTEFPVVATAVGAVADAVLADTIEGTAATTQSLVTDLKGVLQRIGADSTNNSAATTLVDANDDGSLFERLEGLKDALILARGTFTTSSATVPADTGRTEANDYWNGCYLVPTAGAIIGQPRLIVDFANAGGVFTLDTDIPFTAVPGTVAYAIIPGNVQIAPTADSTADATPAHVIGRKTDAAATGAVSTTESLMAYAKQLVTEGIARDAAITVIDDFLDTEIGTADGATTESINGKLGTDTELADRSLYDQINGAGPAAAATAAAPANDVSLYGAVRYISEQQSPRLASKAYANLLGYDTAAAFTVTGDVIVRVWGVVGATGITCTSGTTTLSVGTTEDVDACLPATTIDNSDFAATDVWVDNNPEDDAGPVASTSEVIIGGGADIILTRNVDDLTAGTLTLYCEWRPLSSDGNVVAA